MSTTKSIIKKIFLLKYIKIILNTSYFQLLTIFTFSTFKHFLVKITMKNLIIKTNVDNPTDIAGLSTFCLNNILYYNIITIFKEAPEYLRFL